MSVAHSPAFVSTRWSVVLDARNPDSCRVNDAFETLCRTYWYPLYAYLRRRGHSPEAAEDLTQGFFACLIEKNYLRNVHPEKGKFRSFLLTAINRFASDQMDREHSQK